MVFLDELPASLHHSVRQDQIGKFPFWRNVIEKLTGRAIPTSCGPGRRRVGGSVRLQVGSEAVSQDMVLLVALFSDQGLKGLTEEPPIATACGLH